MDRAGSWQDLMGALLAAMPDPTLAVTPGGRVLAANPAAERMVGLPAAVLAGTDLRLLLVPPDHAVEVLAVVLADGSADSRPVGIRTAAGSVTDVLLGASVARPGGDEPAVVLVVARDVSDTRMAENQLRAASRYARSLLEASLDPLVTISVDGKIMDVNRATESATGMPREALIGSDFSDYFTEPDKARAGYREVFSTGQVTDYPLALRRASGEVMDVLYNASVYHDEDGRVAGVFAAARDVTLLRRSRAELENTTREVLLLAQMTDLLQSCQTTDESFPIIGTTMQRLFPGASGRCLLTARGGNVMAEVARWGPQVPPTEAIPAVDCWSLRRGHIHDVGFDDSINPPCKHIGDTAPPYVCVPLLGQGQVLGIVHLVLPAVDLADGRGEHLRNLARTSADSISLALANLRLRETMLEMTVRDPLTGLYNRRFMEEALAREVSRAERLGQPLVVAMLDVDHFKTVNDTLGHEAGDRVLVALGELMAGFRNGVDIACRYGGEEFLLVLPGVGIDASLPRLEALRAAMAELDLAHGGLATPAVTVSVGVAAFPEHGSTPTTLVRCADAALYRAKRNGRDRIEVGPTPAPASGPAAPASGPGARS